MVIGKATNTTVVVIMAALTVIISLTDVGLVRRVSAAPKCGSGGASTAYSSQVTLLVSELQQAAPTRKNFKATLHKGPVKGTASCTPSDKNKNDRDKANADCLACLSMAEVDLADEACKGKKSGSSTGASDSGLDGKCKMSFGPK